MDAWSTVCTIAVSPDGKWIVSGTNSGLVTVWNAESHEKVIGLAGHEDWVRAVDVSPDASKIATGSYDKTACIWSLSIGERILGPLRHDWSLAAVKFSPDGRLIATATWCRASLRIYDSDNGRLLIDFPIQVSSSENQSLAWDSDSKYLFALSRDGNINRLDVYNGTTLSRWPIHSNNNSRCITLASDCQSIAASAGSSVSFWDTTTQKQIGSVIEHPALVVSIAISEKDDLVIGGGKQIAVRNIHDVLHSSCSEDTRTLASRTDKFLYRLLPIFPEHPMRRPKDARASLEKTPESPHKQDDDQSMFISTWADVSLTYTSIKANGIANLEKSI
ncbi:WD40-repeat-containing domain protein [Boletus edulis]|nr:WD40-repeat-containing domain protein [Boletus edulis]